MMSVAELARAVEGELLAPSRANSSDAISGVAIDSRTVEAGDLFVALAGERFNGHDFIGVAVRAGAACALVQQVPSGDRAIPLVRVADTRQALGKLAGWWRDRYQGRLVGLTGSNGKTTVKEMTAAILRAACGDESAVLATSGNFNNDIGMPLTLLKLRPRHRYAMIEMGMNHRGEIDYLTRIAKPDLALINNAQRAHLGEMGGGEMGGMQAVAEAKAEIFAGLKPGGIALINADDAFAAYWIKAAAGYEQLSFGITNGDVRARMLDETMSETTVEFTTPLGKLTTLLRVPGEHNVRNAAAACAIAVTFKVDADAIVRGLTSYTGTKGRLQRKFGLNGAVVIDDSYNANPDSAAAAIAVLAKATGDKLLVMGDMGELGNAAASLHAEIGALAKNAGIGRLFALGDFTSRTVQAFGADGEHFPDISHLVAALRPLLQKDMTVLVKGSRFMRMERVVEAITVSMGH